MSSVQATSIRFGAFVFLCVTSTLVPIAAFAGGAESPPPRFRVQVLPALPGGLSCFANDINDGGQVVGGSTTPGTGYPNAVTWIDGEAIDITGLGVSGASAEAINDAGVVVGISDSLGLAAFAWQGGVLTPLGFTDACCSSATGINQAGSIVGIASLRGPDTRNDGVLWDGTQLIPLGTLGGSYCQPRDINAQGRIVGSSDMRNDGQYYAFLWEGGVMAPLQTLIGEGAGNAFDSANAINDAGLIVGSASPGLFGQHAVKWAGGEAIELASLGGPLSEANDVNESGWIVGDSWTSSQASSTGALWIGERGFDLSRRALLEPGDHVYDARGVNEGGQIVGEGVFDGAFHAYVLTPLRPGDVNGDGAVDVDDLFGVINGWGACPSPVSVSTCPADLDSNGAADVDDLFQVINDWG